MVRVRRVLVVMALAIVGSVPLLAQEHESRGDEVVSRGREVYRASYCGACHTLSAIGARGAFGPSHDAMGVIAAARLQDPGYQGAATDAEGYLRESITAPSAYLVPGWSMSSHAMPAYDLPEQDLNALVTFLLAQDGRSGEPRSPEGR